MQLTLNIPDDLFDDVKDRLSALPSGVLESIAMDAVLGFIENLRHYNPSEKNAE